MGNQANLAQLRRVIVEIGIFSFFVNALMLVMPLYMLQVYDRVLPSSSMETLLFLTIIAGAALALLSVLEIVRSVYANRIAARLDVAQSRRGMLAAMESTRASVGDIQPLRDLATVRGFIGSRAIFALFDLPFAPLFILLLWLVHPALFGIAAGGAVILAGIAIANQFATKALAKRAADNSIAAMMTAQSFVRNAETLRAMGMTGNAISAWARHHAPALVASDEVARVNALFAAISRFLRLGLQIAMLGVGAWLVLEGKMTAGMIFAASLISGRGLQPIDQVIGGWRQFVDVHAAWRRFSVATAAVTGDRPRTELPEPAGRVDIENLIYFAPNAAPQAEPVIKRISLRLPSGTITGIVGPSGAGKSTLARLMVGAIRPRSGVIRIDGADIANWPADGLGRHIGYLPQDVELLPGTIAQNIARFTPGATDAEIIDAAKRAQVHELVLSLPNGYDTVIGPQGMTLSGGQRQRIGLARAFFGDPTLLVLDEPNANLDAEGDAALERAIDQARVAGATVLIITQRSAIARKLDALLVLRNGMIEDYGPRDQVIARQQQRPAPNAPVSAGAAKTAANVNVGAPQQQASTPPSEQRASPFAAYGPGLKPLATTKDRAN